MKKLNSKQKNILIGVLLTIVLVMTIAYSTFSSNLNIQSTSNISNTWDVEITKIEADKTAKCETVEGEKKCSTTGNVSSNITDNLSATFEAALIYPGDSVTYTITVENKGSLDATLKTLNKNITKNSDNIDVSFSGLIQGHVIATGGHEDVIVKITYNGDTALSEIPVSDATVKSLASTESVLPTMMANEKSAEEATINISFDFSQERASDAAPGTKYLVSYDCTTNGGTSCVDFDEYLYGSEDIDLTKEATKDGYTFIGWNTDSSATTKISEATVSGNTTLYAIYKKTLTVNYAKGEASSIGKENDSCDIYNNAAVTCTKTLPSITTDATHKVDGWYKGSDKVGAPNASYTFTEDTNLTAGITAIDIVNVNTLDITLEKDKYTYDGSAKEPEVTVKDGETTLTKDTDYTVEYSNNTDNGTATVTIKGANNYNSTTDKIYNGEDTKQFTIEKADPTITLSATSGSVVAGGTVKFNEKANVAGSFGNVSGTTSVATVSPATASVAANTDNEVTVTGVSYGSSTITITFTPSNTNYNTKEATYTVSGYNLATPGTCNSNLVYDGTQKTLASGGAGVTYTNNTSTNAVTNQSVTVTANEGYRFSNGNDSTSLSCSVSKATPTVTLSATSGITSPSGKISFIEKADIAGNFGNVSGTTGVATLSPASYTSVAANTEKTVDVTGGSTVTGTNGSTSTITVTFTPSDTTNYNNATATYTVRNDNLPTITDNGGGNFTISYNGICNISGVTCKYSTNGGTDFTPLSGNDKTNSTHTETLSADNTVVGRIEYDTTKEKYNFITVSKGIVAKVTGEQMVQKLNATVVTSGDGLYKDATETDRYIYKGANPNNYIQFNGETWRIYSIESDGSIKIVKHYNTSESIPTRAFDAKNARPSSSHTYCNNSSNYGCNAWAATANLTSKPSSFVNGSVSGTVGTDSQMLTYLNSDTSGNYYYSLTSTAKNQIVAHDWNVGPAGTWNGNENMTDLVSATYEGKYKWNGKVALLTKSEYIRANTNTSSCGTASLLSSNYSSCKGTNYLYNSSTHWWLLSPRSGTSNNVFYASNDGTVSSNVAYYSRGVRPALYLSSKINITGKGTSDTTNIYKIS